MNSRTVRWGVGIGLAVFLIVFFLPLLSFTLVVTRTCSPSGGLGWRTVCTAAPPGGSYSGYQSVGYLLTGWGGIYSSWFDNSQNWGGYVPPTIIFNSQGPSTLLPWGALFSIFIPSAAALAVLFAPELVRISRVSRVGFASFGVSLFVLSNLFLISMGIQGQFQWLNIILAAFDGPAGVLMMLYNMHLWPLGTWERDETITRA